MKKVNRSCILNENNIDIIAEEVMEVCDSLHIRREQSIKTRLIIEDALAVWMKNIGPEIEINLKSDKLFVKPYLEISVLSEKKNNPLIIEELGFFTDSILKTLTIAPEYFYRKGRNVLHFNLPKPARNPIINMMLIIMISLIIGILGLKIIPQDIITILQDNIISPTYGKVLDLLRCIAAPLIFCSVTWGIYGIGDTSTLNKLGKGLILYYLRNVFIVTVCCIVFFPLFGCALTKGSIDFKNLFDIYSMFLEMIPTSIVEPFSTGNTLQIIVMAVCVGIALIYLGKRTEYVAVAIEQINHITTFLMTSVSKLIPFIISFVLINMIWSGNLSILTSSWKFILLLCMALFITAIFIVCCTSVRYKVNIVLLIKKVLPSYLIALVTASSSAAFTSLTTSCEKEFGIDKSLTGFGVPLGIVIFKMASAINNMMIVFYIAGSSNIDCSINWIIMAVIVSCIVAVATPPIPGGAAVVYTMLFAQLGLPEEGLAVAFTIDMLSDFLITSTDIFCLPFGLTHVASRYNLLDVEILRKDLKS